jgi:hypothetical protein
MPGTTGDAMLRQRFTEAARMPRRPRDTAGDGMVQGRG